jgi:cytochrome c nitrite reductase small subunit
MNFPPIEALVLGTAIGVVAGVGGFTFVYGKGASYLTNDPAACANCHIMREQYEGWTKASHRAAAVCNDCHTPAGVVAKYATKATNGFRHSLAFTTGHFHEPLQITPRNRKITEAACRTCHQDIVQAIDASGHTNGMLECVWCHRSVGHLQ